MRDGGGGGGGKVELIGQGREAEVFALDGSRVLRRFREGRGPAGQEARLLRRLDEQGYPVPKVYAAEGSDLVLERLHGPTMAQALRARPWRALAYGTMLGRLHRHLHTLPAPDWLPRLPDGGDDPRVLHLDLHPENVILTEHGPRVIDWTTCRTGRPETDVARTQVILRSLVLRSHERLLMAAFLRSLTRSCGVGWRTDLPAAIRRRLADPHLLETERDLLDGLRRRHSGRCRSGARHRLRPGLGSAGSARAPSTGGPPRPVGLLADGQQDAHRVGQSARIRRRTGQRHQMTERTPPAGLLMIDLPVPVRLAGHGTRRVQRLPAGTAMEERTIVHTHSL